MLKAVREGAEKAGFEPIRKYINKFNMNMQKQTYLSPETETLVVRFEAFLCTSPGYGAKGAAGSVMQDDDDYDYSI